MNALFQKMNGGSEHGTTQSLNVENHLCMHFSYKLGTCYPCMHEFELVDNLSCELLTIWFGPVLNRRLHWSNTEDVRCIFFKHLGTVSIAYELHVVSFLILFVYILYSLSSLRAEA